MGWIQRRRYRLLVSYMAAVWIYGAIFAFVSGVYPRAFFDWVQFLLMPLLLTIQLPALVFQGSGWLFLAVAGLLATGIYHFLKYLSRRREKAVQEGWRSPG